MDQEDKYITAELLLSVQSLLQKRQKLLIKNLPLELSGTTADLLYDYKVKNTIFVELVEALALEVKGKSDEQIIERFELLEKILNQIMQRQR